MEKMVMLYCVLVVITLISFFYERIIWYRTVIRKNPVKINMRPVSVKNRAAVERPVDSQTETHVRLFSPRCNFKQYLKYIWLTYLPYIWSIPIKYLNLLYQCRFKRKFSEDEKRERLAKMVLETSLVIGFDRKTDDNTYMFRYENFRMPTKEHSKDFVFLTECRVTIEVRVDNVPILKEILLDDVPLIEFNEMFAFLNIMWAVNIHPMTHAQSGNISEMNRERFPSNRDNDPDGIVASIDDMHASISGINEAANHYPADIYGIRRSQLQLILGHNSSQTIHNHRNILSCNDISNFVDFCMKARLVFIKHLSKYGVDISTVMSNTIFHSLDHHNMGLYFVQDSEKKEFLGIDARMQMAIFGDFNYDWGRWQGMRYTKYKVWNDIYIELVEINECLARHVHMFVAL